jgi:threonine dehydratase
MTGTDGAGLAAAAGALGTAAAAGMPIGLAEVMAARERLRPYLAVTPLRAYGALDEEVGGGVRVLVKHENHQPTNAFKVRNALSAMTLLPAAARRRGVMAATRGNHGAALAYAGERLGIPVAICVPFGNNPEKNRAMLGFGAELIEHGRDFDEALAFAVRLAGERGAHMVHSANDAAVVAGAGTIVLEMLEQAPDLEALVIAVGGGSQAAGALAVVGALRPEVAVYAVQAAAAPAIWEGWRCGRPVARESADTFADGLATRACYELTFAALLHGGLRDFVLAAEAELAAAVRMVLRTTHNLVEGAAAAPFAGLKLLRERLAGQRVGVILSGSNIDQATLARVLAHEI